MRENHANKHKFYFIVKKKRRKKKINKIMPCTQDRNTYYIYIHIYLKMKIKKKYFLELVHPDVAVILLYFTNYNTQITLHTYMSIKATLYLTLFFSSSFFMCM